MRIERRGTIEPLTPKLVAFMTRALGGRSMDDLLPAKERRVDYVCLNGLLAVEMKSLEEDGSERMDNLTDELRQRVDWPIFLGAWPIESVLQNLDDPDAARKKALNRIGRAIVNHLKKANKQLAAHEQAMPRKNLVRLVLMINEDHEIYDPQCVAYILKHELFRMKEEGHAYRHIDTVIYLSERHAMMVNGQVAFPVIIVEGPGMLQDEWKASVCDRFVEGWCQWTGHALHKRAASEVQFTTIEQIPQNMRRQDAWNQTYRRNPYLRHYSNDQLRERWDETFVRSLVGFVKSSPAEIPMEAKLANMEKFSHLMLELAHRGITAMAFQVTPERELAAARRLGWPHAIVDWLEDLRREDKPVP